MTRSGRGMRTAFAVRLRGPAVVAPIASPVNERPVGTRPHSSELSTQAPATCPTRRRGQGVDIHPTNLGLWEPER